MDDVKLAELVQYIKNNLPGRLQVREEVPYFKISMFTPNMNVLFNGF